MRRGQWFQVSWVFHLPSCIFPELFCFNLLLKCGSFAYYGIRREDCEGTSWYSPISESSVAASGLISVGFCALLELLTWWVCPSWRYPYPVEGIGVFYLASVPCVDEGSSVMPLGAAWGADPGGRYWGPGYRKSSCQASLRRETLVLRLHYFERVKFSCVASSEWSYTRFYQFNGTVPFLMCYKVDDVLSNTTWYWGKKFPVLVFNTSDTDPASNVECTR